MEKLFENKMICFQGVGVCEMFTPLFRPHNPTPGKAGVSKVPCKNALLEVVRLAF